VLQKKGTDQSTNLSYYPVNGNREQVTSIPLFIMTCYAPTVLSEKPDSHVRLNLQACTFVY